VQDDGVVAGRVLGIYPSGWTKSEDECGDTLLRPVQTSNESGVMAVVQVLPCGVAVCYVVVCWLVACGMPAGRPV
jgi:hypothetical protein